MTNKRLLSLGKVLFALSFLFIFTGLYLDFEEKNSFSDPIKDTTLIAGGGKVIISTTDGTVVEDVDIGNENSDTESETDILNNDSSSTENVVPSSPTVPESENVQTPATMPEVIVPSEPVPEPDPVPEPVPDSSNTTDSTPEVGAPTDDSKEETTVIPTIEETNNILRRTIEDTYGIKVMYGSETDGYSAGTMAAVSITDSNVIKSGLEQLNTALALYPTDFFREFGNSNFNLKVYLVQRYATANVTGITELYGNNVIISISMDYSFAESFHHETYHYIEHYIERRGGEFSIWNTYNPVNFVYGGTANLKLSFNRTWDASAPFVNNYAQSDADEDRASTFEYMTASSKASCYNSVDYPIWKKSSYMALMIDTYFDTVDSSVIDYWERFIY